MKTTQVFWVLGLAAVVSAAIGTGIYLHSRDAVESPPLPEWNPFAGSGTDATTAPELASSIDPATANVTEQTPAADTTGADPRALELARENFAKRDYEACVRLLEPAAREGDPRTDVHYLLGLCLRHLGRFDAAEKSMQQALTTAPDNVRALVNSARNLVRLQRLAEANARVQRALELAPQDGDAWNVLGCVQLEMQQHDAAIEAFEHAVQVEVENAYAFNNLGLARLQAGEWQAAASALETAVGLQKDVAYFHNNLGLCYERLDRFEEAAAAYAEALRLEPGTSKAQASLARITPLAEAQRAARAQETTAESAAPPLADAAAASPPN